MLVGGEKIRKGVNLCQKRNDWDHDNGRWRKINEQKSGMKRWKDQGNKRRQREKNYEPNVKKHEKKKRKKNPEKVRKRSKQLKQTDFKQKGQIGLRLDERNENKTRDESV